LTVRAVIFDYGMVLTGPPDATAHAELERITGLSDERLEQLYWADRLDYDAGKLTGEAFWRKIAQEAGLKPSESQIADLIKWDARMWLTENAAMLNWQLALKQRGLLTAILSNMGDTVHAAMEHELSWLSRFDVLVFSHELHIVKPNAEIYRYTLKKLGTRPEETLFIDDRPENVRAALALGMKGALFSVVEQLRSDLARQGLAAQLPPL
jgi:putative hydrolase of the HAD superfamily